MFTANEVFQQLAAEMCTHLPAATIERIFRNVAHVLNCPGRTAGEIMPQYLRSLAEHCARPVVNVTVEKFRGEVEDLTLLAATFESLRQSGAPVPEGDDLEIKIRWLGTLTAMFGGG